MTPDRINEARFTGINVGCSQLSSFIVPTDFDRHNLLLINSLSTSKQIFSPGRKVASSKNRFVVSRSLVGSLRDEAPKGLYSNSISIRSMAPLVAFQSSR